MASLQELVDAAGQPATLAVLQPEDLKWVLEPSFATEGQTFYLNLDDGSFALLQMVYSTMGLTASVQTSCRVYRPSTGMNKMKTASHWASVAEFSEDKMSVRGSVVNFEFDPAKFGYRVTADIDGEVQFDFEFVFVGGGITTKTYFNETEDTGYIFHKLVPRATVTGSITVDGEKIDAAGTGFFVNVVQLNPQNVKRWNFYSFTSPSVSVMMMQFIMPEGYDYSVSTVNRSVVVLDGKLLTVSVDALADIVESEEDEETGYHAPVRIRYSIAGQGLDSGEDVRISAETTPASCESFEKLDLLSELPWLVRKALQLLISKPFLFQYIENASKLELEVGGEKKVVEGRIFEETVFLA
ncbi:oxidative stress survival, Svf1-like protein [Hyaloraphidium curvatum]|nr:oxidative stress survival, Svf1-like protein [Hyaloraphidium curvatum]